MRTLEGWRNKERRQRKGGNLQEQVSSTSEWDTVRAEKEITGNRERGKWRTGAQGEVFSPQWKN